VSHEADRFGDLGCAEIVELITDYLEGELPEPERGRFEEHISSCPPCREYLHQMRATVEVAGRLTRDEVPEPTMDALLEAFRAWNRG
jgi:anti-sigma factor RsiW